MRVKNKLQFLLLLAFSLCYQIKAQTNANLIIDSVNVVFKSAISFPYWLKAGQTLNIGPNLASISVLEFTIDTANNNNLKFSQTLSIKSHSRVPSQKTWKIEGVAYLDNAIVGTPPALISSPLAFSTPSTFTWTVPIGVSRICVEVWGGGGTGASGNFSIGGSGGGGGGGGYGYSCFTVQPGSNHTLVVGASNNSSSFDGTLLYATAGANGNVISGGIGGTSNGNLLNLNGSQGVSGTLNFGTILGGKGGNGANGGIGGNGSLYSGGWISSTVGSSPGGGGGGGGCGNYGVGNSSNVNQPGASGGAGKIIIYW